MIILSIRLFFLAARGMNPEGLPQLSGACLYSNPPLLLSLRVFLTPPSLRTPPLYFAAQNTEEEGESNPPLVAVRYPAYGVRQGEKVILDFVTATADIFLTPPSLRTPPLYFAVQNTEEEGESNPPLIADSINSFYCFCFNPFALRALPLYSL